MIIDFLLQQVRENFGLQPTSEQNNAMKMLCEFVLARENESVFVIKGYAGTGKTSLASAFVKTLESLKIKTMLMAPTGRAAKVFSQYSRHKAYTIHKIIYRQKVFSPEMDNFVMGKNLYKDTVFIVDEASMIANQGISGAGFGTGRLLDDLITFVYSGFNCKLIMIGDTAQLPPVGEYESPALSMSYLQEYGLNVEMTELSEVVRQKKDSGILFNATLIRNIITGHIAANRIIMDISRFPDTKVVGGEDLIDAISRCYSNEGVEETMVVTRSNKRANIFNQGIRNRILYREEELERGDIIMVAKNNYSIKFENTDMDFIANGDIAIVKRVRRQTDVYGFRFAEVTMCFPDYNDYEIETKVILDTLHIDTPSLDKESSDKLFNEVYESYYDIKTKRERMKKVKEDPFYNALQVKYAYSVTCHKAQGGQWHNIFLDRGYMPETELTTEYLRWLYTAVTRAKGTLFLVNYKEDEYI